MTETMITVLLLIIAVIHWLPLAGVLNAGRLQSLYSVAIADKNLEILMRHRAALFGILGLFFTYAAFTPAVQPLAFIAALLSISSFFYLAYSVGGYNAAIRKVVIADGVTAACLVVAVTLYFCQRIEY